MTRDAGGGRLTTHVLDTMAGRPAAGLLVELLRHDGGVGTPVASARTNQDGRCDAPLLEGDAMLPGVYELQFHVGAYFRERGAAGDEPVFLDIVPVRFGVAGGGVHLHVPLLVAPFAYSTYRGS